MPRLVSWLERAINEFPQAKATAQQWLAGLQKSPIVNQEEVLDRGLDQFLAGAGDKPVPREALQGWLADMPMGAGSIVDEPGLHPIYQNYSTPGLVFQYEKIFGNPAWDNRMGSPHHYPNQGGYQFHARGGTLRNTNMGRVELLDELQSDVKKGSLNERFKPEGNVGPLHPEQSEYEQAMRPLLTPNTDETTVWESAYHPMASNSTFDEAQERLAYLRQQAEGNNELTPEYEGALDQFGALNERARDSQLNYNMPGRKSWQWHGMADALADAVESPGDALAWPSADVQYRRYFQRDPSALERNMIEAQERLDASEPYSGQQRRNAQQFQMAKEEFETARNSLQSFQNQYDKAMPRHKRWRQLGLEPKLVDLEDVIPRNESNVFSKETRKPKGKYWMVQLTPEIKAKLKESGIPYYVVGGAAVLGEEDTGALD